MRRVLTPKWLAFHVLAVVLVVVMLRLGWWQWHRAESRSGSLQNVGYAFEWPVFAGFVVFMWWKSVRDAQRRPRPGTEGSAGSDRDGVGGRGRPDEPTVVVGRTAPAARTAADDEVDEELDAYNRYLADLNARGRRSR